MRYITKKKDLLTKDEENDLFIRMGKGDMEARKILIVKNLGLVGSVSCRFAGVYDEEDVKQSGVIGLINAVDTYDFKKGVRFSTYATRCILNSIKSGSYSQSKSYRIPQRLSEKYSLFIMVVARLQQKLFRNPTLDEIYEELKVVIKDRGMDISIDRETIERFPCWFGDPVSFNRIVSESDNSSSEFIDFYVSEDTNFDESVINRNFVEELLEMSDLSYDDRMILRMRYGLDGPAITLREIAQKLGISASSVGVREKKALSKIKKKYDYLQNKQKIKK